MIRSIIIDDEPNARVALASDIQAYCPTLEVVGEAESIETGIKAINQLVPELVFLDIQLFDGLGFQILESIRPINFKVIFTTAYSQYAIKAFECSAIDYLLKPVNPDRLIEAVDRVVHLVQMEDFAQKVEDLYDQFHQDKERKKKISIPCQDGIYMVNMEEIVRFESQSNYVMVWLESGQKLFVARTLKSFEMVLDGQHFMRVHQSHLINFSHVKRYLNRYNSFLVMSDGYEVPVATRKKQDVLNYLKSFVLG